MNKHIDNTIHAVTDALLRCRDDPNSLATTPLIHKRVTAALFYMRQQQIPLAFLPRLVLSDLSLGPTTDE